METLSRGNVAYDLSAFDRRYRVREAVRGAQAETIPVNRPYRETVARPDAVPERVEAERVRVRKQAKAHAQRFPVFGAVGFIAIIAMMLMVVHSYVQLNEFSTRAYKMRIELDTLKNEEARLRADFEQKMNLNEVEDYAVGHLGMTKPLREQIGYLDSSGSDNVEVLTEEKESERVLAKIGDGLSLVLEYFS